MYSNKDLFLEPTVSQYGSHMVMTNVQKETKRKYLNIDTRFRDDYNDPSNSSHIENIITLPQTITDVKSIMICNAEIPISYYNISASLGNNVFSVSYSVDPGPNVFGTSSNGQASNNVSVNVTYPFILNDGVYDISGLQSEIVYKLKNQYPTIGFGNDIRFNIANTLDISNATAISTTNSYRYYYSYFKSISGLAYIHFDINTFTSGSYNQVNITNKYDYKTTLGWLLGYRKQTTIYLSPSAPLGTANYAYLGVVSDSIVDLNGPRYLYIVVDEFSKGNQNSFISPLSNSIMNKNILSRLNYDTKLHPFGSVLSASIITGTLLSDRRSYSGKIDIQKLKVQLVNEYGKPVNLNGLDFSFCLEVEHE